MLIYMMEGTLKGDDLKTPMVGTSGLQFFFCSLYISFLRILTGNLAGLGFWWIFFFPSFLFSQKKNIPHNHKVHLFIQAIFLQATVGTSFIHSPVLQSSSTF